MTNIEHFLKESDKLEVVQTIKAMEKRTTGEIVVRIEANCPEDSIARAQQVFKQLYIDQTAARNGVLLYIAVEDHCFAVLGDEGINSKVEECFWDDVCIILGDYFAQSEYGKGIIAAVEKIGEQLALYFPENREPGADINELPDEISFG
ncbi:MAG: TPM domain-containing protein [Chitinophagales bacterium]|nr:TPM domain-containing protein [Bacteroidota bacterium]MCB9042146.1 TPM domain-containing protein [Chitinophagales bacterium]